LRRLHDSSNADKWNRSDRYYDQTLLAYIGIIFDPEKISVDVGANVGYITRFLALRSRKTIFAIEPGSANLSCLRENVASIENVKIIPYAAAEIGGKDVSSMLIRLTPTHTSDSVIFVKGGLAARQETETKMATSQWSDILPPAALEAHYALTASLDPRFAKSERDFYESRTFNQLKALAAQAWDANEPTAYQLARSYAALVEG
jgi:FkbM family methyltransferase